MDFFFDLAVKRMRDLYSFSLLFLWFLNTFLSLGFFGLGILCLSIFSLFVFLLYLFLVFLSCFFRVFLVGLFVRSLTIIEILVILGIFLWLSFLLFFDNDFFDFSLDNIDRYLVQLEDLGPVEFKTEGYLWCSWAFSLGNVVSGNVPDFSQSKSLEQF